jgi:DNA-binding beta-propeller fold protein YncE
MTSKRRTARPWLGLLLVLVSCSPARDASEADTSEPVPQLSAATGWPADLPAHWVLGPGTGIYVDARDHVWLLHRPERITDEDMAAVKAARTSVPDCCVKAPPLIEVDPEGRIVRTLGSIERTTDWPYFPHGVFVDHEGFLWIASQPHHALMKLTADAKPVLTIGEFDRQGTSADSALLGGPADMWVDPATNELFVADGYQNRRVAVFDAGTGKYLRSWGAYGQPPDDAYQFDSTSAEPPRQFNVIHGLNVAKDGMVYVADASNGRVQAFRKSGEFVAEVVIDPEHAAGGRMTDLAFSADPEQRFVYVADGTEHKLWIVSRSDLKVVGEFGGPGTAPGQFGRPHNIATDSKGNIYVAEAHPGRRFQKIAVGSPPSP